MNIMAIDAGGSSTRIKYLRSGKGYTKVLPPTVKEVPLELNIDKDVTQTTEDFIIYSSEGTQRYMKGFAMDSHKEGKVLQPDNQELKSNQKITYINIIHAIASVLLPLNSKEEEEVACSVVIPAGEFCSTGEDLTEVVKTKLAGKYEVHFPLTKETVKFRIPKGNIMVGGEGIVYLIDLIQDPRYSDLIKTSEGIVIDAGRRTVDICLIRKAKPVKKSAKSLTTGGILIEASIVSDSEKAGRSISGEDVTNALVEGKIRDYNISPTIVAAKKRLASSIQMGVTDSLTLAELALKNISYAILIGRPFINGEELVGSEFYKGDLESYLREFLPANIEIITPQKQEFVNVSSAFKGAVNKFGSKI